MKSFYLAAVLMAATGCAPTKTVVNVDDGWYHEQELPMDLVPYNGKIQEVHECPSNMLCA